MKIKGTILWGAMFFVLIVFKATVRAEEPLFLKSKSYDVCWQSADFDELISLFVKKGQWTKFSDLVLKERLFTLRMFLWEENRTKKDPSVVGRISQLDNCLLALGLSAKVIAQTEWYYKNVDTLFQEVGKDFALNWFRDGVGYFMQAKTWVPLIEEEKALILYIGWDLANRRGNETTLEKFDESEAIIRFKSQFFMLYHISGHLRNQISFKDYKAIFETIWLDRASKAGWNLNIKIDGDWVTFHFTK